MPKTMSGLASGFHNSFFQSLPYFYFEPVETLIFHNISSMDIAAGIWFKLWGRRAPMIYFRHFPLRRFQNIKIYKDLYALQVLWSVGGGVYRRSLYIRGTQVLQKLRHNFPHGRTRKAMSQAIICYLPSAFANILKSSCDLEKKKTSQRSEIIIRTTSYHLKVLNLTL